MPPQKTDRLLACLLGDNLKTATFRLVAFALAGSAALALIIRNL